MGIRHKQECINRTLMKFNKDSCKVVPLGRSRLLHPTADGADWLGSGSGEEDLDSLEEKASQCCALQQRMLSLSTGAQ